jgi:hypothetical protein
VAHTRAGALILVHSRPSHQVPSKSLSINTFLINPLLYSPLTLAQPGSSLPAPAQPGVPETDRMTHFTPGEEAVPGFSRPPTPWLSILARQLPGLPLLLFPMVMSI